MSEDKIQTIRERFLNEAEKTPNKFHAIDIERVRTEEWQIKRFILDNNNNIEDAYKHLVTSLEWKKSFGVHDLTCESFPREFYEFHGVEVFGKTRDGQIISWEVLRQQYSIFELNPHFLKCFAINLEKLDRLAGEKGFIAISDANGAGYSNINFDFVKFKLHVLNYYPLAMKAQYLVDQPWLLSGPMMAILSLMNKKVAALIHIVSSNNLSNFIEPSLIPVALGGQRQQYQLPFESKSITTDEMMASLKIDQSVVQAYYKIHNKTCPQIEMSKQIK